MTCALAEGHSGDDLSIARDFGLGRLKSQNDIEQLGKNVDTRLAR